MAQMAQVTQQVAKQPWVGQSLPRREDLRFVTGKGTYVGDIKIPGMAYAAFVRSPYAHAKILAVRKDGALALPGVLAVFTGEDVSKVTGSLPNLLSAPYKEQKDYGIAVEKVRYVGEPVAVVVAGKRETAYDGAEAVEVDYEPLESVTSPERATKGDSPRVHENLPSNTMWNRKFTYGDVDGAFRSADVVVKEKFHFHRFTSAPLEPNAILVSHDRARGTFTVWSNNQRPAYVAPLLSRALRIPQNMFHFINPDIGGGFGIKVDNYPYILVLSVAARAIGKPILWEETRREHLLASCHGNEVNYEIELALMKGGEILGYRARAVHDEGAYMRREPLGALNFIRHATITYKFRCLEMEVLAVATNKCPVGPNRCYGKMQQNYMVERIIDTAARRLGIDPVEIRMKNFVPKSQMPYETPTGAILDGGDYEMLLQKLIDGSGYPALMRERSRLREQGKLCGIGISIGMDSSPVNPGFSHILDPKARVSGESEAAWVRINEDASISAAVGTSPQGQGHETSVAQVIADILGVSPYQVNVLSGFDTWTHPYTPHSGTYASRFSISAAAAVSGAAEKLRKKIVRIACSALEVRPEEVTLGEGKVSAKDGRSISLVEVAEIAWKDMSRLPKSEEPGLMEHFVYRTPLSLPVDDQRGNFALSYSSSACLVMVEVDRETGVTSVRKIRIIEDSGRKINPMIVEGQVHGQIAHQLGAAIFEQLLYDDDGQLLTSSFMDYSAPLASDLPPYEVDSISVPSIFTAMGTRGTAEGGGAPLIACVNAVNDALAPLGRKFTDSYVDPQAIKRVISG